MLQNQTNALDWLYKLRNTSIEIEAGSLKITTTEQSIERIRRRLLKEIEGSPYWRAALYARNDQSLPQVVDKPAHLQPVQVTYCNGKIVDATCAIQQKAQWLMHLDYPKQQILALVESGEDRGVIRFEKDRYRWKFDAEVVRSASGEVKVYLFDQERWQGWFWSDPRHVAKSAQMICKTA